MARQPAHMRGNRVTGNLSRLNNKALKVLYAVKFHPSSITREEIMQKTSLSQTEVTNQVKLLLGYNIIKSHSRFPTFPTEGWRVYTESEMHDKIIQILKQHGFEPPMSEQTRSMLGDYYPSGFDLEGLGHQTDNGRPYPGTVPIIEELQYRKGTLKAMKEWRDTKHPFKPKEYSEENVEKIREKFEWIVKKLARVYQIREPKVVVGNIDEESWNTSGTSGASTYSHLTHTITMNGRMSVLTLLHEFAHSRGFDETDAVIWSVNLFKRIFPVSYSKLVGQGHILVQEAPRQFQM